MDSCLEDLAACVELFQQFLSSQTSYARAAIGHTILCFNILSQYFWAFLVLGSMIKDQNRSILFLCCCLLENYYCFQNSKRRLDGAHRSISCRQYKLLLLLSQQIIQVMSYLYMQLHIHSASQNLIARVFSWLPALLALHVAVNMLYMINSFHIMHV